jgi:hypothetical protein
VVLEIGVGPRVRFSGALLDTPLMRRRHEPLEVITFAPRYLGVAEAERTLPTTIKARRLSTNPILGTLTLRGTPARICIARRILENLDHPPAEIDLSILVIRSMAEPLVDPVARLSLSAHQRIIDDESASHVLAAGAITLGGAAPAEVVIPAPAGLSGISIWASRAPTITAHTT